jgi:DNA repair exonuclease SbcCD nuclease subunit
MSKALITADLHMHSHKGSIDRLQDCLNTLNWIFETAESRGVKHIFFLGDLFHEQGKIDVLNYLRTFEVFMRHMIDDAKDIDVYLLLGNHDMYYKQKWDVNSIKPLTAIPRVNIVDKPCTLEIGGRAIDWLPHIANPLQSLEELKKNHKTSLLLGHLAVSGASLNVYYGVKSDVIVEYDNDMKSVDGNTFSDWELTLLGHYHGQQKLCGGKVEYVGSPLQLSFGEAFQQKHVIILDLDTLEKEYVENNFSPKHYLITPDDIENETYDLNNHFVRVIVDDMGAKEIVDLKQKVAKDYHVASFDFKTKDKKIEDRENDVQNAKQILQDGEVLEVWIKEMEQTKQIPLDSLDLVRLLDIGKQICAK